MEVDMAVVKVIELLSESANGWEAATRSSFRSIKDNRQYPKCVYNNMQAIVENNRIINYRLNVKISFIVR